MLNGIRYLELNFLATITDAKKWNIFSQVTSYLGSQLFQVMFKILKKILATTTDAEKWNIFSQIISYLG